MTIETLLRTPSTGIDLRTSPIVLDHDQEHLGLPEYTELSDRSLAAVIQAGHSQLATFQQAPNLSIKSELERSTRIFLFNQIKGASAVLIERYKDIVRIYSIVVGKRRSRSYNFYNSEDLEQLGAEAFLRLVKSYDSAQGEFQNYILSHLQKRIIDVIREENAFSRNTRDGMGRTARKVRNYLQENDLEPTVPNVEWATKKLCVGNSSELNRLIQSIWSLEKPLSLSQPIADDLLLADALPNNSTEDEVFEEAWGDQLQELQYLFIRNLFSAAALSKIEIEVLEKYYQQGRYLHSIGQDYALTEGRLCQIKQAAIKKLRDFMISNSELYQTALSLLT